MEFTAEWKSLWPISSTFSAPLFIPNEDADAPFGPLIFTSKPSSCTALLRSPSLAPRLPPPYPQLSLSRFLQNYNSVPSPAASISSLLGPQLSDHSSYFHGFNSLQLLQIPHKNLVIVFFPAGENSDRVGFTLLSAKDGILSGLSRRENFFQLVKEGNVNHQRITRLLVNPVDDVFGDENADNVFRELRSVNKRNSVVSVVGFLMVCTNYSVCWYRVGITMVHRRNEYSVCLDYLGCANSKTLRGNAVVNSCWSPHLREECLVLLENGDLLLFDVNSSSRKKDKSISLGNRFISKKMHVSLKDKLGLEQESGDQGLRWFGCEFSWHPRILITSNRNEVVLVDLRPAGECSVNCLLKLCMLSAYKNDGFFALSRAGPDGFLFTVATENLLLLCDVRKPLMPVLRWTHGFRNPRYVTVFRLSEMRANAEDTKYKLASESGYCILLGSFWDNEFSLFCYGPDVNGNSSVSSEISKFCNSYYAWGLPSEFSLSGSDCNCGSCVVREEFMKASLPDWIDWRQKKQLILGFGFLHPDLYTQLSSPNTFGGFMLIRLTSSGKLDAQHYHAAWESEKYSEAGHKRKGIHSEDNLLYKSTHAEYDGEKKFKHLKLDCLNAYLKDELAKYIVQRRKKMEESGEGSQTKHLVKSDTKFHQEICCRLKDFGLPRVRSSLAISDVLKDITLPTSIHEIALRSTCAALPTNLLQLAFFAYSDFDEDPEKCQEPLEFLDIPDQSQLPPYPVRKPSDRSNKWSNKVQPSDTLVGPILPPPVLATLHKLCTDELKAGTELYPEESEAFSAHSQFKLQCDKVTETVQEHVSSSQTEAQDDDYISLADDAEDMSCATQKLNFSFHKASAFLENPTSVDSWRPGEFSTHVFRKNPGVASDISAGMVGKELFDVGCPVELKFDDCTMDFGPKELEAFKILKKRDLDFQKSFKAYQDFRQKGDELEQE